MGQESTDALIGLERSEYSVVEGETLELCVVGISGTILPVDNVTLSIHIHSSSK